MLSAFGRQALLLPTPGEWHTQAFRFKLSALGYSIIHTYLSDAHN